MKSLGAAFLVAALLATSACGGGRPSQDDVSKALQKGVVSSKSKTDKLTLKKKQADCTAKVFVKSKLSDETLQKLVDDHVYTRSKKNDAVVTKLSAELKKCGAA